MTEFELRPWRHDDAEDIAYCGKSWSTAASSLKGSKKTVSAKMMRS